MQSNQGCFGLSEFWERKNACFFADIAMKLSVRHRICMVHCEENGEKWKILHERLQKEN